MECPKCGAPMYKRVSKLTTNSTKVYICSKCDKIIYVWQNGDMKEETK